VPRLLSVHLWPTIVPSSKAPCRIFSAMGGPVLLGFTHATQITHDTSLLDLINQIDETIGPIHSPTAPLMLEGINRPHGLGFGCSARLLWYTQASFLYHIGTIKAFSDSVLTHGFCRTKSTHECTAHLNKSPNCHSQRWQEFVSVHSPCRWFNQSQTMTVAST